jgi:hypothetical protein
MAEQAESVMELMNAPHHKSIDYKGAYGRPALTM